MKTFCTLVLYFVLGSISPSINRAPIELLRKMGGGGEKKKGTFWLMTSVLQPTS